MGDISKIEAYINNMVNSGEMSEEVGTVLYSQYKSNNKSSTTKNLWGFETGTDNVGEYYIDAKGKKHYTSLNGFGF
jgi:hypothetical protein